MKQAAVLVLAAAAMLACTAPSEPAPSASVSPNAPRQASSAPSPSPLPTRPGDELVYPESERAAVGAAYATKLYTHCGLDFALDFDGSFWQLIRGAVAGTFGDPYARGTLTLRRDGLLEFRADAGGRALFVRYPWPKPLRGCD